MARIFDRTRDMAASMTNHALTERGELARGPLGEITAPVLVVHGTADPGTGRPVAVSGSVLGQMVQLIG